MKAAAFIPIKQNSERVTGKNFKKLGDKKLYQYMVDTVLSTECFEQIFIDTDSEEVIEYVSDSRINIIHRQPQLATKYANGNDLLVHHQELKPGFDLYFQLFVTAPFLTAETIVECVNHLKNSKEHDSIFTSIKRNSFFWMNNIPVNYRPGVLPRSQDLTGLYEETTGLYGITSQSLAKYRCRIGEYPYMFNVSMKEAIDINVEDDFKLANYFI